MHEDYVGPQGDQLLRKRLKLVWAARKAGLQMDIAAFRPTKLFESLPSSQ
jgi:hypothetical protein